MFNPQPKPEPRPRKDRITQWREMKERSMKKSMAKKKIAGNKDAEFYAFVVKTKNPIRCAECASLLPQPLTKINFHHMLPKSTHPYFRYEIRNVICLCAGCHAKAESAISAPKMNTYQFMEDRKHDLLSEVGINYQQKYLINEHNL